MPEVRPSPLPLRDGYSVSRRPFTRDQADDPLWERLFPADPEGYAYHLAFAEAGVADFTTFLLVIERAGEVLAALPAFITDYRLDATVQGRLKRLTDWLGRRFPKLLAVRLLCLGSPVTDSARLGVPAALRQDAQLLRALSEAVDAVASQEGIGLIAYKDVLERDREWLDGPLGQAGYTVLANMPVARNAIDFPSTEAYLAGFSKAARKDLRRKGRAWDQVSIEEVAGTPGELAAIHRLYLNCYAKSELKFEQLTEDFFRKVGEHLGENCRFVLYRAAGQLIGFNLLVHRNGLLIDKYLGMDYAAARPFNLYFLSWMHNLEMCLRDGFHTFQSGQGAYATKKHLRAELEMTWLYFRHRNPLLNLVFRGLGRVLAYGNFDTAVADEH